MLDTAALDPSLVDGVVVGVPGVVAADGTLQVTENVAGLEGRRFGEELQAALDFPVTLENDINLAALGEQWQGVARGVADFVFLSVGTGMGAGLVLGGELHRGRHGAAGELDFALVGFGETVDPSAPQVAELAQRPTPSSAPSRARSSEPPAPAIRRARAVVDEIARRIALHVAPVAAVADVELVVLGGGIGANGDLLLDPVARLLAEWLPFAAAGRGLDAGRGRRADRRGRGRAPGRARERLRQTRAPLRPERRDALGCRPAQRISRASSAATSLALQ